MASCHSQVSLMLHTLLTLQKPHIPECFNMYLVINKCVRPVKVSNFSGHYLRNRSTLDIGVLGLSAYFNIRNTLPKSGTFLLWHPVYATASVHSMQHSPQCSRDKENCWMSAFYFGKVRGTKRKASYVSYSHNYKTGTSLCGSLYSLYINLAKFQLKFQWQITVKNKLSLGMITKLNNQKSSL
jgi:hypothetical protein